MRSLLFAGVSLACAALCAAYPPPAGTSFLGNVLPAGLCPSVCPGEERLNAKFTFGSCSESFSSALDLHTTTFARCLRLYILW